MSLPLTGERTVPEVPHENYWLRRHEVAYRSAAALCSGARVLDAGAGEGYGAAAIRSAGAREVVALDYDAAAIAHVRDMYGLPAIRANLVALPFNAETFDLVISLQTIEHVWDQPLFAAECARVLAPAGRLVVSTPNRLTFPPGNVFHARELDSAELIALVKAAGLRIESVCGVHHGPRLEAHGGIVAAQLATDPQEWTDELAAMVASVTVDDFVMSADRLETCLDLYLVAART